MKRVFQKPCHTGSTSATVAAEVLDNASNQLSVDIAKAVTLGDTQGALDAVDLANMVLQVCVP